MGKGSGAIALLILGALCLAFLLGYGAGMSDDSRAWHARRAQDPGYTADWLPAPLGTSKHRRGNE